MTILLCITFSFTYLPSLEYTLRPRLSRKLTPENFSLTNISSRLVKSIITLPNNLDRTCSFLRSVLVESPVEVKVYPLDSKSILVRSSVSLTNYLDPEYGVDCRLWCTRKLYSDLIITLCV